MLRYNINISSCKVKKNAGSKCIFKFYNFYILFLWKWTYFYIFLFKIYVVYWFFIIAFQVHSNRITICEALVPSFVCINNQNSYRIMYACNSSYNYVCLNETGSFINCKNFTENTLRNQIMQTDEIPMELLCSTSDGKYIRCIDDPYISVTCISTKNWNLVPCEEAEDKSEIGIPVCVQVILSNY